MTRVAAVQLTLSDEEDPSTRRHRVRQLVAGIDAELILMDEPTAGMTAQETRKTADNAVTQGLGQHREGVAHPHACIRRICIVRVTPRCHADACAFLGCALVHE